VKKKAAVLVLVGCLSLLLGGVAILQFARDKEVACSISSARVDWGDVQRYQKLTTTLTVTNHTRETVSLDTMMLSCTCLTSTFSPTELAPQASVSFDVSLKPLVLGIGKQSFKIETSPKQKHEISTRFLYNVVEGVCIKPESTWLGVTHHVDSFPKTVEVSISGLPQSTVVHEVIGVKDGNPNVRAALSYEASLNPSAHASEREISSPGPIVKITISNPKSQIGNFSDNLVLVLKSSAGQLDLPFSTHGWLTE
jgi:hypothetical protein